MPKIKSGYKIFTLLRDSGTGRSKLEHILSWFETDRKGKLKADIPAEEFMELMAEADENVVPPTTKLKAESFHRTGKYEFKVESSELDLEKLETLFEPIPDDENAEDEEVVVKPKRVRKKADPELV